MEKEPRKLISNNSFKFFAHKNGRFLKSDFIAFRNFFSCLNIYKIFKIQILFVSVAHFNGFGKITDEKPHSNKLSIR